MDKILAGFLLLLIPILGHSKPWNSNNDPSRIINEWELTKVFNAFPQSGRSEKTVWTGDYWPLFKMGTAKVVSGELSPLEKLGKALGEGTKAHDWEIQFSKTYGTEKWAGHCNGLAGAGVLWNRPKRFVEYNGVIFSPKDIEALLVEIYQGPQVIVGERCDSSNFFLGDCEDINPGSFHILIGTFLGLNKTPLIIDLESEYPVWNFPIKSYESQFKKISLNKALKLLKLERSSIYPNVNASEFVFVKTVLDTTAKKMKLKYIVELNSNGEIIGGEWVGSSKKNHPDFAWFPWNTSLENPYIDIIAVTEIATQSF